MHREEEPDPAVRAARKKLFDDELRRRPKPMSLIEEEKINLCVWTGPDQYVVLPPEDDEGS